MKTKASSIARPFAQAIAAAIVVALLTAGSCGGGDAGNDTSDDTDDQDFFGQTDESDESGADNNVNDGAVSGGDFMTIFGVAPFGQASLQDGFGEYELIENEIQRTENVFFVVTGAERDQLIGWYTDTLSAAGYQVGARIELGDSALIDISMANDPSISAAIQVGPLSPTDPTLGVNQSRTQLLGDPTGSSDDPEPPASASTDASGDSLSGDE